MLDSLRTREGETIIPARLKPQSAARAAPRAKAGSSLAARRVLIATACLLFAAATAVGELFVSCPDSVPAGEPFLVEIASDAPMESLSVTWLGRTLRPECRREEGQSRASVLLGMGLEDRLEGERHVLEVQAGGFPGEVRERRIHRVPKDYPVQHLVVEERYSKVSAADEARSERENAELRAAMARISPERRWRLPMARPVPGEPSSAFGLRRFFNGEAKRSHAGLDLRAAAGDSVLACEAGRVILVGDHFFAGRCVCVDHGQGVVSLYFHLSAVEVAVGQELRRGELIGKAGATGRVTGPHLHWGVSILGQYVDPLLLL